MTDPRLLPLLTAADLVSVAVFAVTGALVASRKQMDLVGFMWLAIVTGIGGGTVRDLLLGVPVFWIKDQTYVAVCLISALAVYLAAHIPQSRYRLILWLDALGLALVSVVGTAKGLDANAGPVNAIVMGVVTASVGGIIRDILGHEPSIILRREIYVTAAVLGALVFVAATGLEGSRMLAITLGFLTTFVVRGFAIRYGWALSVYRGRAGRSIADIDAGGGAGKDVR